MSKYGFVYCLMNPSFDGLYKIGCTERAPQQRADELSRGTGVPSEYSVMGYIECDCFNVVERDIHRRLEMYRPNGCREFFRAPLDQIAAHLFHHPEAISWVDQMFRENVGCGAWELQDPYQLRLAA